MSIYGTILNHLSASLDRDETHNKKQLHYAIQRITLMCGFFCSYLKRREAQALLQLYYNYADS